MIRVAICDDMKSSLDEISSLVKDYFSSRPSLGYIVEEYASPLLLAESGKAYDILILDIIMPALSGTEIAKRILSRNPESKIIFISSSRDYAVDAFALGAVHYITKPVERKAFEEAMNRAMESLSRKEEGRLMINMRSSMVQSVECSKIIYIESIGYTRIVHTSAGNYEEVKQTLSALYEELEKICHGQFIMPYRGYIVNLNSIRTITPGKITLCDGSAVLIKRGDYRRIRDIFFSWVFSSHK